MHTETHVYYSKSKLNIFFFVWYSISSSTKKLQFLSFFLKLNKNTKKNVCNVFCLHIHIHILVSTYIHIATILY